MKILKTPWKNDFMELVSNSKKSIKITAPFVKENICDELISKKRQETKLELITSFKLTSIYKGSLDLNGLEKIINHNGIVKNLSKLHSKIYLFDEDIAIITSSNMTNGGLLNNFEYGIYIDDPTLVSTVVNDFSLLSKDENVGKLELSHINDVRNILSKIPPSESIDFQKYEIEPLHDLDAIEISDSILNSSLSGWKLEVLKCAQSIQNQIFSTKEINEFEPILREIYPNNNHITEKIRQQLQYLRDLGLIEFLGNGQYKKSWK